MTEENNTENSVTGRPTAEEMQADRERVIGILKEDNDAMRSQLRRVIDLSQTRSFNARTLVNETLGFLQSLAHIIDAEEETPLTHRERDVIRKLQGTILTQASKNIISRINGLDRDKNEPF